MELEKILPQFFKERLDSTRPILLALSGGPDSLALFHLLLDYQRRHPVAFAVAHVDHGWREESVHEAEVLKKMVEGYKIPFHFKKIDPKRLSGNLEAVCRLERLKFFSELCSFYSYQSVLLAHHLDDHSEVILKKTFEGCSLPFLHGIEPVSQVEGVLIWRPLLGASKQTILSWLKERSLEPFEDKTNQDPKFLRARMRSSLLPNLSKEFGKEIREVLVRLGDDSKELHNYLIEKTEVLYQKIEKGVLGQLLDLSGELPLADLELKFLLKRWMQEAAVLLSRSSIEVICKMIQEGVANRWIERKIYIDRRRIFILKKEIKGFRIAVKESRQKELFPKELFQKELFKQSSWREFWNKGRVRVSLPFDDYKVAPASPNDPFEKTPQRIVPIGEWWSENKVPALFRNWLPVIWVKERIAYEFLTGCRERLYRNRCCIASKQRNEPNSITQVELLIE
jgi:tRNA(Ile)-lysidine synthase